MEIDRPPQQSPTDTHGSWETDKAFLVQGGVNLMMKLLESDQSGILILLYPAPNTLKGNLLGYPKKANFKVNESAANPQE